MAFNTGFISTELVSTSGHITYRQYTFAFLIIITILLSACVDTKDSSPDDTPTVSLISSLNGVYTVDITETDNADTTSTTFTARALIYEGMVYGLREDKAFFGSVTPGTISSLLMTLEFYNFTLSAADDNEYAATNNNDEFTVNAVINGDDIQGVYESTDTITGNIQFVKRDNYDDDSDLTELAGGWNTASTLTNTLDVSDDGMYFIATEVFLMLTIAAFMGVLTVLTHNIIYLQLPLPDPMIAVISAF
jgi:hypothetical protein